MPLSALPYRHAQAVAAGSLLWQGPFMQSPFERRLSTLYANYSDAWRARFGMPVPIARAMPIEQRR